jgi:hypothetical protein
MEPIHVTDYGFLWGPVEIERSASHKGHVVLTMRSSKQILEIRVTPTGFIRVGKPVKKLATCK